MRNDEQKKLHRECWLELDACIELYGISGGVDAFSRQNFEEVWLPFRASPKPHTTARLSALPSAATEFVETQPQQ
jgi:hypothetical protein